MIDWGTIVAAIATIAILTFLFGDNPIYRAAESLLVGISVGYAVVITWQNTLVDLLFRPLVSGSSWWLLIPLGLGLMLLGRFFRLTSPLAKLPIAVLIGSGAGVAIPAMLDARIIAQLSASTGSLATGDWFATLSMLVLMAGLVCSLAYFYFSREQVGWFGGMTRSGIYFLMIFFGTTFGYTVMSRMSTLIGRLEFLLSDFLGLIS